MCLCVLAALHAHTLILRKSENNFWESSPSTSLRQSLNCCTLQASCPSNFGWFSCLPCRSRGAGFTDALMLSRDPQASAVCHKCFFLWTNSLALEINLPIARLCNWHPHLYAFCNLLKRLYVWRYVCASAVPVETWGVRSPRELVFEVVVSSQKWLLGTEPGASAIPLLALYRWTIANPLLSIFKALLYFSL